MPDISLSAPDDAPTTPVPKTWFVYLVRAENGALYCGISDDPERRFIAHQRGKGARFFCSSPAVALVYVEACRDRSDALRQERLIKKLRKSAKEILAASAPRAAVPIHGRDEPASA
ncbi:GIY-YIG nuclease family protein [Xanthomonas sp. WHRI 1810A]|uniref:GIY-YIG nuclease family protein n=1 Tax=Xanthomonas sp. WHRI 1810A TaxID=3161565 RepID=UPI0032E86436